MKARNASIRIAAMLAVAVMTTLTLSLQFGLARHYTDEVKLQWPPSGLHRWRGQPPPQHLSETADLKAAFDAS